MELRNNTRVFFDKKAHLYLLDGEKLLTGVTSLLSKHNLSPDYSNIPRAILKNAAEEGTSIHEEIEDYDNGMFVPNTPLLKDYRKLGLRFIANEYLVSDNEMVASSIDGVYEGDAPNTVMLVDYKSTEKVHKRSLAWQLGIYKVFFERQNPEYKVESCQCLHIDKKTRRIKGLIPIEPVTEKEVESLLEAEKNGRTYIDVTQEPNASLVLSDTEMKSYSENQAIVADLRKRLDEVLKILAEYDKRILDYMLENGIDTMGVDGGSLVVKKSYSRITVDSAKLKAQHPDIYEAYSKETKVNASLMFKKNK